ncbi:PREDICTED: E3 ubiquitin-protein ligase RFWD3-like [Priapulus caudatus]|uniref:RING-type E3 ubiquitin transferase n=1 Tax=Priapulus caudatus TaxID=37621 RepID=A0ABM1EI83_PRICU|nr:PREDICTED: E3 ubiquitin-protein ligase RFWD3-like [Priapulus caudatus]
MSNVQNRERTRYSLRSTQRVQQQQVASGSVVTRTRRRARGMEASVSQAQTRGRRTRSQAGLDGGSSSDVYDVTSRSAVQIDESDNDDETISLVSSQSSTGRSLRSSQGNPSDPQSPERTSERTASRSSASRRQPIGVNDGDGNASLLAVVTADDQSLQQEPNTGVASSTRSHVPVAPEQATENMQDNPVVTETANSIHADQSSKDFRLPAKRSKVNLTDSLTDEEGEMCTICFEHWNNSGEHRIASLKCGHLFGKSCILKWLSGQGTKCPQCNAKARKADVRVIYTKTLKAVDTTERDRALSELVTEREQHRKVELDLATARLHCQLMSEECRTLRHDLTAATAELEKYRSGKQPMDRQPLGNLTMGEGKTSAFSLLKTLQLCEAGCRVLASCNSMNMLAVSQPSNSVLFPGFGVKKICTLEFKTREYVAVHSKMIRDIAFNPSSPDGLMLSASVDKTVKVTSLLSNTIVQNYDAEMPVWSCCWSADVATSFYAGLQNGTVLVYDTRNTRTHCEQLNTASSRSPVVSLQYVPSHPSDDFRQGGLLVGQLNKYYFYENRPNGIYRPHVLPMDGNLTCMCFQHSTRNFLASFRPSANRPTVRHVLCELAANNVSEDVSVVDTVVTCHPVQVFTAGTSQKMLTRSCLVDIPTEKRLFACAGDESSLSTQVWDTATGRVLSKLPSNLPVIDVCPVETLDGCHLAALTDKYLQIYKWT